MVMGVLVSLSANALPLHLFNCTGISQTQKKSFTYKGASIVGLCYLNALILHLLYLLTKKQAVAELCQAQVKLE